MRKQLILAYYTFFVSIALFLWALFIVQKPEGFLLAFLFIPTSLYFFLSFTGRFHPEATHAEKHGTIPLVILLTLFISAVSIFVFSTIETTKKPAAADTTLLQHVAKQIATLSEKLDNQNNASNTRLQKEVEKIKQQLMKETDANPSAKTTATVGTITPKDMSTPATIYQEKSISSPVVGTAEFGKNYTYLEKDGEWYLIFGEKEGYVSDQFVKEVAY